MVDPDAPSAKHPCRRHWLHWLLVNIPGHPNGGDSMQLGRANPIMTYMGPAPPPGSGPHRYVLLAFKQPDKTDALAIDSPRDRAKFDLHGWLKDAFPEHSPLLVAGNFFYCEVREDDTVA